MKNKMMKTAGLLLASITMLMANGVVASENKSIEKSECPSFHCVNYISGLEVTKNYKGEIASISVNRNSESKTGEITTFTSQDGTLEIKDKAGFSFTKSEVLSTSKPQLEEYEPVSYLEKKLLGEGKVYIAENGNYIINK